MSAADLDRLLRSAAQTSAEPAPEPPFGFLARVVALSRSGHGGSNDLADLARFLRRAGVIAFAVLLLAGAAAYRQFRDDAAFTAPINEYAIGDSAIQTEFSQ